MGKKEKRLNSGILKYRLELLAEAKIKDLLKDSKGKRYEASGIQYKDGHFYIVLDNMRHPVRISKDLHTSSEINTLIKVNGGKGTGYEDISYNSLKKRWYCLIEADKTKVGDIKPRVDAYSETFEFEDYSSLDIQDRYVTVISQETSAVWVGRVRKDPSSLDDLWEDDGQIYLFPRNAYGKIIFCNLEGITWLKKGLFAVVSDKAKPGKQAKRCKQNV